MGWYAVGTAEGSPLQPVELAGRRLVLWRRPEGPRLLEAICPHLGADLSKLGKVVDDELLCPFHGFRFDADGRCVGTGYNTDPPGRAVLGCAEVVVRHGLVFAWHGPEGEPPAWLLPEVDDTGWAAVTVHTLHLRGHPQDVTENSVDVGHFTWVHGYQNVHIIEPLQLDGLVLRTTYGFSRRLLPRLGVFVSQEIDLHVHGLGYSRVEVKQKETGIPMRLLVLPTPRGDGTIDLHLAVSLPTSLPKVVRKVAQAAMLRFYVADVRQDERFLANKHAIHPPALARGDGPIGRYQAWARQFYPKVA